ncbi:unnamed protein product [Haemonchus placei]|uniref:Pecanex-like protein n=1 Tax=Haemonchus placei TaxID=6290 RepID=A0A0N4WH70_HAEPC|nr:unnamed protein product [Haemonchus placei]
MKYMEIKLRKMVCLVAACWHTEVYRVITRYIMAVNVLTILCYALFLYYIRKATSLIVTSLTVVFGYFTTTIIGTAGIVLNLDIPRTDVNLLAGTFVSTSSHFLLKYCSSGMTYSQTTICFNTTFLLAFQ